MGWLSFRTALWLPVAMLLGLALREYHFLRCPAVWHDEAALIVNALGLSFAEMCGPLLHAEAAPPLFLMLERVAVIGFGEGEYALRLIPFLASCLALILFAFLCRRLFDPLFGALAVTLFAVSDRMLFHACEAKPYAVDVLVAVAAAWWFVRTERWALWQRCVPAMLVAPVAVWVSFPACFIAGGLIVALFPAARRAALGGRIALAALALSVAVSFVVLAFGPIAAQRCDAMDSCWTAHFPDWSRPWLVPMWVIGQTLELCRYCLMPLGQVFAVFAVVGAVMMWRTSSGRGLLAVLVMPVVLALAAACLHKYPYGGMRVDAFATPALCLLTAMGARELLPRLARQSRSLAAVWLLAFVPPLLLTAYRVFEPWPRAANDEAAAFVIAHRESGEPIFGNFWEHKYYLRDEDSFRAWQGEFAPDELLARRAWVIHTADRAEEDYPFPLPPEWEIAARTKFVRTSVFELRRVGN